MKNPNLTRLKQVTTNPKIKSIYFWCMDCDEFWATPGKEGTRKITGAFCDKCGKKMRRVK